MATRERGTTWRGVAVVLLPLLLPLAGCGGADQAAALRLGMTLDQEPPRDAALQRTSLAQASAVPVAAAQAVDPAVRLIAYTATLQIEVPDLDAALAALRDLADTLGGYLQASNVDGSPDRPLAVVRLRVPSDRFDPAMARLRALADRVVREETSAQDVTEEHVDLRARLRSQQAVEAQLLTLLNRADVVSDVLAVQRELSTVRQEVERLQGRLQVLEGSVAESTITVHVHQQIADVRMAAAWAPDSTFRSAATALVHVLQAIGNTAIVAGVFTPIWAPVAAGIWWRRRRGRRPVTGDPAVP